jgi:hypothetical protein
MMASVLDSNNASVIRPLGTSLLQAIQFMFITNLFVLYQAINKIGHVVTAKRAPEVCLALHAEFVFLVLSSL